MHPHFRLLALSLFCALIPVVYAQGETLQLKLDRTFMNLPKSSEDTPAYVAAKQVEGQTKGKIVARGEVELRKRGQTVFADNVVYDQTSSDLIAQGNVRLEMQDIKMQGPHVKLNLDTNIGDITTPAFQFPAMNGRGRAENLHMAGKQQYSAKNVEFTTCSIEDEDWLVKAGSLDIDNVRQEGLARNARVEFMGVPILYVPKMSFALSEQRKSGFLSPVYGNTRKSGNEISMPYYWNIAPNRDATITPRVMTKRGLQINNEFRYMGSAYGGEAHLDILPNDAMTDTTRYRTALKHFQNFGNGLVASANLNHVSDNNYFRDLTNTVSTTSMVNLVREGMLGYSGGWWNTAVRMQSYQTLQDPGAPIIKPYQRLPQVTLGARRQLGNADFGMIGEFTSFSHSSLVSGQRLVMYPSISYPLSNSPSYFLTPKVGVHFTQYSLGSNYSGEGSTSPTRILPIVSLDSGLVLERDWKLGGKDYLQTLEPRVYFLHVPYKNQDMLPNFDTAQADFNFAQMFTESRFFGHDRVGDATSMTYALTSRLLSAKDGAERLRIALGQRFSFRTPQVNLIAPETATTNTSDILFAVMGQVTPALSLNGAYQYNPNEWRDERINLGLRYRPEAGKVLNLGYRFTRNSLRQMDISTQWPLWKKWYAMGRWNYSLQDSRLLEMIAGLEYNEDCWAVRVVAQRFVTATNDYATGIFAQLELNGLARLGSDPLNVLRQGIIGFQKLNEPPKYNPEQGLR
ncbi:LPS-assembly protein LptD [Candidatus Nitrotoga fabula]|uniref:LPS-assembly protein LptD n=1 Tax=Candidatus Nitrotoga fabula TaxID=2182327 RepID=UPI001BB4777E|nr:LPS-assembly protein LptD [Candidatus Nitrotoga fabula]